jgi:glycosyltransferase involved in cell wall biosynthesis
VTRLGLVVGEDNWSFFREIAEELEHSYQVEAFQRKHYNTPILSGRLNQWLFQRDLRSIMQRNQICFFEWASELLVQATRLPKTCSIITRLHSFELFDWAPKVNWDAVDRVILVSQAMQEMFCDRYPQQRNKTVVIYNGRSLEKFAPPPEKRFAFNLGMLCYIAPIKRVYETVLMLYSLRQQGADARLFIAGRAEDPRYTAATYRLVQMLNLQEAVIFEGQVGAPEHWLQKIDVYISNSFWEGQQVALLEAMASGCYCLAHRWAGADEMLPEENLFITEAQLQQQIMAYATLPETEKHQRQQHLRTLAVERFNIARSKEQIRRLIDEQLLTI